MADEGGSDFDVYNGRTRSPRTSATASQRAQAEPIASYERTLLGLASANPPPAFPRSNTAPLVYGGHGSTPPPQQHGWNAAPDEGFPEAHAGGSVPPIATDTPVDMDWDDEDEKTTIFERANDDAARALLRSAPPPRGTPLPPSYAASPTMPPSRIAPPGRVPNFGAPRPAAMPRAATSPLGQVSASPFTEPRRSSGGKFILFAIVSLLFVGLAAASAILFLPKSGALVVTVAGPGNKPIDSFQILLNGKDRCQTSPCRISGLEAGTHLVRVVAPGYQQTADQAVKVEGGEDAVVNIALVRASDGTGLRVVAEGAGLSLQVDGRDVGLLPAEVKDLAPGDHVVKIVDKNERYEPFEKHVAIEADKMLKLEPKLKVSKGLAVIRAGDNAADARVLLVSGSERRPIPNLPIKIDIATDKPYSLVASKRGYSDYKQDITFEDGQAEKTFVISLSPSAESTEPAREERETVKEEAPPRAPVVPRARGASRRSSSSQSSQSASSQSEEKDTGSDGISNGTLNISSSPPSTVVLDGKPLGSTPRGGISVAPGPHTLLFVHPDFGRKTRSVVVQAGKATSASVNFP